MLGTETKASAVIQGLSPINGGPAAALDAARRTTLPLDELAKQIANATDRVREATTYTRNVADTLFGSQPETVSDNRAVQAQPPTASKLGGLSDQMLWHHTALHELEQQLNRLEVLRG